MIHTVADTQECVELLSKSAGETFFLRQEARNCTPDAVREEIRKRLFVRVLPGVESIEICHRNRFREADHSHAGTFLEQSSTRR